MKKSCFVLCFLLFAGPTVAAAEQTVHIVSQKWENYTSNDKLGYMWELIELVFNQSGYSLKSEIVPYKRGVEMVRKGLADAWVASYKDEYKFAIYPQWPHDYERTSVVALKNTMKNWKDITSITGTKLAFIRGYELDSFIDVPFQKIEVDSLKQAVDMVILGRAIYAADAKESLEQLMNETPNYASKLELRELFRLGLYLAFNDSPRSRKLIEIWDENFPKLLKSGKIKAIYQKNGIMTYQDKWDEGQ